MLIASAVLLLLLSGQVDLPPEPAQEILDEISARGRELFAYDQAAWHGSDALAAIDPDRARICQYIAYRSPEGMRVAFGCRNPSDTAFLVAYEAVQKQNGEYKAKRLKPPLEDTDYLLRASLALALADRTFEETDRPYNGAALPTPKGEWWVYLFPASTEVGVWPLGGDIRYTISKDGKSIIETRRMHNAVLETGTNQGDGKQVASIHIHVLECIPEDTDVLAVLSRTPSIPEYVICDPFSFAIDEDGSIRFIGHSEELWGDDASTE